MQLAIAAVTGVLLLWTLTRALEPHATYFPVRGGGIDPSAYGLRFEEVEVVAADGVRLHAWHCEPLPGRPHRADLVFFHGNAGNIGHRLGKIRSLAALGVGVFVFDYRGFGRSAGRPADAGLLRDAEAAVAAFRARRGAGSPPLGFYGESIGGLLAVREAGRGAGADFLVLEGAFPGKRALAARVPLYWPFLPFVGRTLDIAPVAGAVRCPTLVLHAVDDEVAPIALGRRVRALLRNAPTQLHELARGGHNDAFEADPSFFPRIDAFLAGLPGGR